MIFFNSRLWYVGRRVEYSPGASQGRVTISWGNVIESEALRHALTATVTDIFFNEYSVLCSWYLVNHILQHNLLLFILCPIQELDWKSQLTYSEILIFISISSPVVFHVSIFGIIEWWLIFIELDAVCTAVNDTNISNFLSKEDTRTCKMTQSRCMLSQPNLFHNIRPNSLVVIVFPSMLMSPT